MKKVTLVAILAVNPVAALAAKAPPAELLVTGDGTFQGSVNGVPMILTMRPNGSKVPVLSARAAAKAGLKSGWFGINARVGPTTVSGYTAVTKYSLAGFTTKRRIGWFQRTLEPGVDVLVGPAAVAQPVVTFRLREPATGERLYRLPLVDSGYTGMGTNVRLGKQVIRVDFSPFDSVTVATAAAGSVLSQSLGGNVVGGTFMRDVAFEIERPHRRLELGRPLAFGPFRLLALSVRTSGEATSEDSDPDEIVVTAQKQKPGPGYMQLGRDALAQCSSLTFDKKNKEIRLMCR